MLDVYERLMEVEPATPPLLVLGWAGKPPEELKARPHLYRHVHVLPRVPDRLLSGLYTGAVATILTSRHEGFGFPVVEAMACGTPVVTSRVSSMPEAAGGEELGAALLVDPHDTGALTDALHRALADRALREQMRVLGFQQAADFTWGKTAAATVAAYQQVLGQSR